MADKDISPKISNDTPPIKGDTDGDSFLSTSEIKAMVAEQKKAQVDLLGAPMLPAFSMSGKEVNLKENDVSTANSRERNKAIINDAISDDALKNQINSALDEESLWDKVADFDNILSNAP